MNETRTALQESAQNQPDLVPVIGIGASAGGLQALEQFFNNCAAKTGVAFVVVQHLSPNHDSLMEGLLARNSSMPVQMLRKSVTIAPDHIYLIPPGHIMQLEGNTLILTPREPGVFLPIDIFFQSLAEERQDKAVAVILSGTGTDGTQGAQAIAAANGTILVQDPKDASFSGMPQSVVDSGLASECLPAVQLARRALNACKGISESAQRVTGMPEHRSEGDAEFCDPASELLSLLEQEGRIDFREYKQRTYDRRIQRRMDALKLSDLSNYVDYVRENPGEARRLLEDLLIGVTSFFRDEDAFLTLQRLVIPEIIANTDDKDELRVWVAGCSTGEEAYSIAMLLSEGFTDAGRTPSFRIFATDINQSAIDLASQGIFSKESVKVLPEDRITKFFSPHDAGFRVEPELRSHIVFACHDILHDPPFTRLSLASSRNMLIYLRPEAQERAIKSLRHAVKVGGYLFLGRSETLPSDRHDFKVVDGAAKIYQKIGVSEGLPPLSRNRISTSQSEKRQRSRKSHDQLQPRHVALTSRDGSEELSPSELRTTERALLEHWAPPAILVDARRRVLQFQGDVSRFLRTRTGDATLALDDLLPDHLSAVADFVLAEALATGEVRVSEPVELVSDDKASSMQLVAVPVTLTRGTQLSYICFERRGEPDVSPAKLTKVDAQLLARRRVEQLERLLRENRVDLQNAVEGLETSNEELQSTNEELMASNEELQSANEELQSVNEELNTVNAEFQAKLQETSRLSDELDSVLKGAGVSTIFLDEAQLVRRFSPGARAFFRLRDSDIGRPLSELSHSLKYDRLHEDVVEAMQSLEVIVREVSTDTNETIKLCIVPVETRRGVARRTVLTLTDVSAYHTLKQLQSVVDALPQHIAVLRLDGTIALTNRAWNRFAIANGDSELQACGIGVNYLSVCGQSAERGPKRRPEKDEDALRAYRGIRSVLEGTASTFSMRYPCHSNEVKRWFYMTVAPVQGEEFGAVVSHDDITEWWCEDMTDR